jgi:hypothetical protein
MCVFGLLGVGLGCLLLECPASELACLLPVFCRLDESNAARCARPVMSHVCICKNQRVAGSTLTLSCVLLEPSCETIV